MVPAEACPDCYDEDAKAFGWHGPAVVFGLAFPSITPGQVILDIGIGTGLSSAMFHKAGLKVVGMDVSDTMLEACRKKGWAARLVCHDLTVIPYPFGDDSFDHAVSTGVFQFFANLNPVCAEAGRIVRRGGIFVFMTGDREDEESAEITVPAERSMTGYPVTMYRHSVREVTGWLLQSGFQLIDTLQFSVWMDRERSERFPARAYLARNGRGM
ncbi:MAG TPA: class I SAM-dependent methyltransferase [Methanoregulaceae archaeon]|nr:class I SAM-dependent methyltransferase [Methanoregulaceae archaeon]HQN89574.1 class I SAM-dependent methyltransferase [Methanoregulaceae archaeon]HQP82313.1 class I SAM-dependent methyltransferase [Methanoregulaceae archaeon]